MKNLILQACRNLTVAAPYAVVGGDGVLVGSIFGVASGVAAIGAPVVIDTGGGYRLTKTAGQAFAQGAKVYWDDAARSVTAVVGANKLIGSAFKAAVGGDATADVAVVGIAV